MSGEPITTVVGNLTADPEIRFAPSSGHPVANFTIASTPRYFDRQASEWRDGETLFLRCTVWQDTAEHVAESLTKGARVIASGRLTQRSFETREGERRTVVEMQVDEVGPSLRWATATVRRANRASGPPPPATGQHTPPAAGGPQGDPWAADRSATYSDEPPF